MSLDICEQAVRIDKTPLNNSAGTDGDRVVGTSILMKQDLVLTCAHVVAAALGMSADSRLGSAHQT